MKKGNLNLDLDLEFFIFYLFLLVVVVAYLALIQVPFIRGFEIDAKNTYRAISYDHVSWVIF